MNEQDDYIKFLEEYCSYLEQENIDLKKRKDYMGDLENWTDDLVKENALLKKRLISCRLILNQDYIVVKSSHGLISVQCGICGDSAHFVKDIRHKQNCPLHGKGMLKEIII